MDLSQHGLAADLLSDEGNDQTAIGSSRGIQIHPNDDANTNTTADAEDEFVDAMDSFVEPHPPLPDTGNQSNGSESNFGILERYGRWLMAIPRDDVAMVHSMGQPIILFEG